MRQNTPSNAGNVATLARAGLFTATILTLALAAGAASAHPQPGRDVVDRAGA